MNNCPIDQKWFAIVNPNAGHGKGKKDWKRIAGLLESNGIVYEMRLTERPGHGTELVGELISEGYRKFISVGGDGTLHEITNGIFKQKTVPTTDITISKIPVGTGNDWGRMFGIPLVYEGAVKVIKEARTIRHDVGIVKYYNGDREETRYFINIAGIGFESTVVKKTNIQKEKGKGGKAIYFYNLLSCLIAYRNTFVDIAIDGKTTRSKIFSINVGNGRFCGGGMRQTPEALPDDGKLDITVIREMGRIEIIKSLNLLYNGTILSHSKVDGYRSDNLKVVSDVPLYLEADGETLGHTPAEFSLIPAALNIVYATKLIQ